MAAVRKYHHILTRVEYPREGGYRMEPEQLPDWIYLTITEQETNKFLTVHSRIHMNKEVRVGPTYRNEFTDQELLRDLSADVRYMFL